LSSEKYPALRFSEIIVSINLGGTMYTDVAPVAGLWQLDLGPNGHCGGGSPLYTTLMLVPGSLQLDTGNVPTTDPTCCTTGTMLLASGSNPASVRSVRFVLYDHHSPSANPKMFLLSVENDGVVLSGEATRQ
jgi:hypothetical protein